MCTQPFIFVQGRYPKRSLSILSFWTSFHRSSKSVCSCFLESKCGKKLRIQAKNVVFTVAVIERKAGKNNTNFEHHVSQIRVIEWINSVSCQGVLFRFITVIYYQNLLWSGFTQQLYGDAANHDISRCLVHLGADDNLSTNRLPRIRNGHYRPKVQSDSRSRKGHQE